MQLLHVDIDATAAASGGASFGASQTHSNIDSATAASIASATTAIVQSLIGRGDIIDSCLAAMLDPNADNYFDKHKDFRESCEYAMHASADAAAKANVNAFLAKQGTPAPK